MRSRTPAASTAPAETPADRLQQAVDELAQNVSVLTDIVDQLREDLSWLTWNGLPHQPIHVFVHRMPLAPPGEGSNGKLDLTFATGPDRDPTAKTLSDDHVRAAVIEDIVQRLAEPLGQIAHAQAFEDFLHMSVCALSGGQMEDKYMDTVKRHTEGKPGKRGCDSIAHAFGTLVNMMEETRKDILGDMFQGGITYGEAGQFLTPEPICQMMATMTVGEDDGAGKKSVCDPCGGSGRMLLAVADLKPHWEFVGQDVDLGCVRMTAINLALRNLYGYVIWGNSLGLEKRLVYHTGFNLQGVIREIPLESCPAPVRQAASEPDSQPEPAESDPGQSTQTSARPSDGSPQGGLTSPIRHCAADLPCGMLPTRRQCRRRACLSGPFFQIRPERGHVMLVELQDGYCRRCGGQLQITGADDATMDVECTACGDGDTVEPDAFNDGGITNWPQAMVEFGEEL